MESKCPVCRNKVRVGIEFRNEKLCSLKCYRQTLSMLHNRRERLDKEKRWRLWWHGDKATNRLWIYFGRLIVGFEYNLWSSFCHLKFGIEQGDHDVSISAALPPVAVWMNLELPWQFKKATGIIDWKERELQLAVHNGAIWLHPWTEDGVLSWSVVDWLLGEMKMEEETLAEKLINVTMPEGVYAGKARFVRTTHYRKRSQWLTEKTGLYADVEMENERGIPFPGKGTEAYNCGEDGLRTIYMKVDGLSTVEVEEEVRRRVMEYRMAYPL